MSFVELHAVGPRGLTRSFSLALAFAALSASTALAETLTVTDIAAAPGAPYQLSVPSITVVDGNLSEPAIRALFTTDPAAGLPALADLTATSVTIPTITVTIPPIEGSTTSPTVLSYHDLELQSVSSGVATSGTIGSAEVTGPEGVKLDFGQMTMGRFDIASLLAFYGLAPGSGTGEMKEIYTDFHFTGGTMSGPEFDCKVGPISVGGFSARPLKKSWTDIYALTAKAEELEKTGATAPPEMVRELVDFYVDLLTAFSTKPMQVDSFDCSGKDDTGKPVHVATGAFKAGGFEPGIYPEFSLDNLDVTVEDDGFVRLGNFTWKRMDFNGALEALKAATTLDDAWFAANWRKLVPIFDGLSARDLAIDVPDEEKAGERVQATLANLDATLDQYVNGMPADISLSLEGLVVPITAAMTESPAPELLARGIKEVTLGVGTKLHWDQPSSTIVIDNVLFDAGALGKISLTGTLGNATEALFDDNTDTAAMAAQMLTIKDVTVHIEDRGVGQLLVASSAKEAGQTDEQFRTAMTGMVQGMTLAFLGNGDDALKAAQALGTFLGGTTSDLTFTITAKDPAGIGLVDLAAMETDPTALAGKVSVTAESSGEPVTLPEPVAAPADNGSSVQDEKRELKTN